MAKPNLQSLADNAPEKKTKRPAPTQAADVKQTIFFMPAAATKQLDIMAAEMGVTKQALMAEAMNGLFKKYGKPTIA